MRDAITKYALGWIQLSLDKKMEAYRSEIRKAEEEFKRDIRANEQRISSIANVALSGFSGRQNALNARRLQAVEKLWTSKGVLDSGKLAVSFMQAIKFEEAVKVASTNTQLREFFKMMDEKSPFTIQLTEKKVQPIESERPFLSPLVWATYSAYSSVIMAAVVRQKFLSTGLDKTDILKTKEIDALVKAVLPEQSGFIDQYGMAANYALLDQLEQKLVISCHDMLNGTGSDEFSVERAHKLYELARKATSQREVPPDIPEAIKQEPPKVPAT